MPNHTAYVTLLPALDKVMQNPDNNTQALMRELKPVKLHTLIAGRLSWTEGLWDQALTYLLENTATPDAMAMSGMLLGLERQEYLHKVDYLRDFQVLPPTVLLGAFDLMRARKAARYASSQS